MARRRTDPPPTFAPAEHPERDALLQAVADNPADDLPRLVYADWQDEHGQPEHAELIRVMCAAAPLRKKADLPRRKVLRKRAGELLKSPSLADLRSQVGAVQYLVRGFLRQCVIDVRATAGGHNEANAITPAGPAEPWAVPWDKVIGLNVVVAADAPPDFAADVFGRPWVARAAGAEFYDPEIGPGDLRAAAASPHLIGLRMVSFWHGRVDAGELARLVLAPAAVRLVSVTIANHCRVTAGTNTTPDLAAFAEVMREIGRSPAAGRLRELFLNTPEVGDATARALIDAPGFGGLTSLGLDPRALGTSARAALQERFGTALGW